MKRTRSVDEATKGRKPLRGIALTPQEDNKPPIESDLSPNRIWGGAAASTAGLDEIPAQRQAFHQLRDWGINE